MRTFLVPTDFSPAGLNAAEYAAQLAMQFGARLILFHAYMMPTPVSEVPYVMATVEDLQKENEEELRKVAAFLQQRYKVDSEQIVRIGVPSDEIRALASDQDVDLVIMGIKGSGGLDKIIGSTTTNSIRKIKTPVLVIPHDAQYRVVKDIVYATDYSYDTTASLLSPLLEFSKKFRAMVHILNVEKRKERVSIDVVPGKPSLESFFEDGAYEFVTVASENVTNGISDYLQNKPGQLLVMVAHKHGFFERIFSRSQTTAMAYETHIPLLILQDKE